MMMGGVIVPYEKLATLRVEHTPRPNVRSALNHILETGCVIKDLDAGLLDFPAGSIMKTSIFPGSLAKTASVFITARTKGLPGASRLIRAISAPGISCNI